MTRNSIIVSILAIVTLALFGLFVRDGLRDFNGKDRTVFVRGLAEQDVKADLAMWPFVLSSTANDLNSAQNELARQEKSIRAFLTGQGFDLATEMSVARYDVQDLLAQSYRPNGIEQGRYVFSKTLILRTTNVDTVMTASQKMDQLIEQNVALGSGSQPSYSFTKLNDVKPDMIRLATANAYEAAEQFASDSGSNVGDIIRASQGVFSINGRDDIPMMTPDAQLNKTVRVVTSVTYKLD